MTVPFAVPQFDPSVTCKDLRSVRIVIKLDMSRYV